MKRGGDRMVEGAQVVATPWSVDLFAVLVGALTGALFACDRRLDIVGCVALGLVTAYGGGIIRDLLLHDQGIYFMEHPDLILWCAALCVAVFFFRGAFDRMGKVVFAADMFSVALFALAGVSKSVASGEGVVISVILGGITAVGGGALRDVCVGEVPGIFRASNFYALAGLGGSLAYVCVLLGGTPPLVSSIICVYVTVTLRYLSVYYNWQTASDLDLTPAVAERAKHIGRQVGGSVRGRSKANTSREGRGKVGRQRDEE